MFYHCFFFLFKILHAEIVPRREKKFTNWLKVYYGIIILYYLYILYYDIICHQRSRFIYSRKLNVGDGSFTVIRRIHPVTRSVRAKWRLEIFCGVCSQNVGQWQYHIMSFYCFCCIIFVQNLLRFNIEPQALLHIIRKLIAIHQ